jgi:hypothetical protein
MPTPVAEAAAVESTAAPGYWAEPVMIPRTPREYLLSKSVGTAMHFFTSRADHFLYVRSSLIFILLLVLTN